MSNYNTQLQSNNTDLQTVLQTLQTKAAGGEQATPVISVNSTNGLITATAGTKSSTHQLAFQAAKTITPSTANQIAVSSGYYTGGNITVKGDSNLVAGNIKSGVSIFGVNGTLAVSSELKTVDVYMTFRWSGTMWYTDENYQFQSLSFNQNEQKRIKCIKSSPVIFSGYNVSTFLQPEIMMEDADGNCIIVYCFENNCVTSI